MRRSSSTPTVVDVGIPAIGGARLPYLMEAIESVMAQTFQAWRLVISEDGAGTHEFQQALRAYTDDPRVTHRVVGKRVGIGKNFTNVVQAGDARYVAILNDDDRWEPEYLERRVTFLDAHPNCGLVFSGATIIDEAGAFVGRSKLKLSAGRHSSTYVLPLLYRANFIAAPTVVARRAAYDLVGATYSDRIFSDHEMWLRLATYFDIGCLSTWDAHYRIHASQTVSTRRLELGQHRLELLNAVDDLPVLRAIRQEAYAQAQIGCALDAVEAAERVRALQHLQSALRTRSLSLLRPRMMARIVLVLAASALGSTGRGALTRGRGRRWQTGGAVVSRRDAPHDQIDAS